MEEKTTLVSMIPSSLEIGIPLIYGFSLPVYQYYPEYIFAFGAELVTGELFVLSYRG